MGCPRYRKVFHRTACAVPLLIQRHSALCRRGHDLRATQGDRSPVLTSSAARRMKKERGTKKLTVATRQRGSTRRESTTKNLVRQNHRTLILSYVKSFRGKRWQSRWVLVSCWQNEDAVSNCEDRRGEVRGPGRDLAGLLQARKPVAHSN